MFGERGDEILVGVIALAIVPLLVRRIVRALSTGVMPLYRTRLNRAEAGSTKFNALVALNVAAALLMLVIGLDLLLGLGLRLT